MNSHNKPEKKAIHANNQPMEVAFHSAPGLSTSLQAVGFEMDVAQLSRGRLEGSFRLGGSREGNTTLLTAWFSCRPERRFCSASGRGPHPGCPRLSNTI